MKFTRPENGNRWFVAAMYLIPLGLVVLYWLVIDTSRWEGGYVALRLRLLAALLQALGPIAYTLFAARQAWTLVVTFALVWSLGLALVLNTRLRNMPYALHFLLAARWLPFQLSAGLTRR